MTENDLFVTENCIKKSIDFGCNQVDIFGIVPKKISQEPLFL